jgi:hypothetical protein
MCLSPYKETSTMPSKPTNPTWHIVSSGPDESLTADLPEDLQAVAQQLADDAQYLAARYPATVAADQFAQATELQVTANGTMPAAAALTTHTWSLWQKAAAAVLLIGFGSAVTALAMHAWRPTAPTNNELRSGSIFGSQTVADVKAGAGTTTDETSSSIGVQAVGFNTAPPAKSNLTEVEMLRIQSAAFEQVIHKLQDELNRRDKQQAEMQQAIDSLRQEIHELHQRLGEPPPADKDK